MKKQVTFVEHLKNESRVKRGNAHVLMRSAESVRRHKDVLQQPASQRMCAGSSCRSDQQVKAQYKGTATDLCGDRLLKTLLAPITVTSATFLQQVLTAGKKSHVCSAANMCSTEGMRWQMKKHYLNVLHACIQSGQSDPCKRKHVDQNRTLTKDVQKDTWWTNKPQPQRECRKRAHSDLVLPKISKR